MPDSKYTKIEDFLLDDSFLEWATGNSIADSPYWNSFIATHPELEDNIKQAAVRESLEIAAEAAVRWVFMGVSCG